MIHAAAIGLGSDAVLITGPAGSGKSTTSLTCAARGFDFLGDDYVAVEGDDTPKVLSIYNSVKYMWDAADRLPELNPFATGQAKKQEKGYIFLGKDITAPIRREMNIKAILFPMISRDHKTTFLDEQPQKILLNLATSTITQVSGNGGVTLKNIISTLGKLPVYRMSLGTDPDEIAESIRNFMKSLH